MDYFVPRRCLHGVESHINNALARLFPHPQIMSGTTVTKVTKTKEKKDKRKKCSEGFKCAYKNEYQHNLEYSHDDESDAVAKEKNLIFMIVQFDFGFANGLPKCNQTGTIKKFRNNTK